MYKSTLVVMAGFPGVGKTTLAYAIGTALQWPVLDKDRLKSLLLNMDKDMSKEDAGTIAYELFFTIAEDFLIRQRISVILDSSALHLFIIERAVALVRSADAQLKIVLCNAEQCVRIARIAKRKTHPLPFQVDMVPMGTSVANEGLQRFTHLP